ncbi:unnamed protein product [Linum trigynum]|uniref:Uncharacterized protein n=1 Tax=Linum trigynum TaxID=586398 RepID=A0AAV2EAW2_9ROSI
MSSLARERQARKAKSARETRKNNLSTGASEQYPTIACQPNRAREIREATARVSEGDLRSDDRSERGRSKKRWSKCAREIEKRRLE